MQKQIKYIRNKEQLGINLKKREKMRSLHKVKQVEPPD